MDKINNKNYDIHALASNENTWWDLQCVWLRQGSQFGRLSTVHFLYNIQKRQRFRDRTMLDCRRFKGRMGGLKKTGEAHGEVLSSTDAVLPCHIGFVTMHIKVHKIRKK